MEMENQKSAAENSSQKIFFDKTKVSASFEYHVWFIIGALLFTLLILFLLWQATDVILLVFGGLLLAIFFRSVGNWIHEKINVSKNWSLTIVLIVFAALVFFGGWFLYSPLKNQFEQLVVALPQAAEQLRGYLSRSEIGRRIIEQVPSMQALNGNSSNLFGRITGYFSSFLGAVVNFLIILAVAVYFAFDPKLYYQGFLKLIPASRRPRAGKILDVIGFTLGRWIIGRLTVMTVNGVLTAIGLWLLGIPLPIPLGILTALLNFIPNIGPIMASIPAILLGLMQGPRSAVYAAIFYVFLQGLEGYVLTPLVQQRTVSLPPVLIIAAQLLLGILFGFLGVLFAVPLLAIFFVLVKMIYLEDVLGGEINIEGYKK